MKKTFVIDIENKVGFTSLYVTTWGDIPLHFPANDETGEPEMVEIGTTVLTFEEPVTIRQTG